MKDRNGREPRIAVVTDPEEVREALDLENAQLGSIIGGVYGGVVVAETFSLKQARKNREALQ